MIPNGTRENTARDSQAIDRQNHQLDAAGQIRFVPPESSAVAKKVFTLERDERRRQTRPTCGCRELGRDAGYIAGKLMHKLRWRLQDVRAPCAQSERIRRRNQ